MAWCDAKTQNKSAHIASSLAIIIFVRLVPPVLLHNNGRADGKGLCSGMYFDKYENKCVSFDGLHLDSVSWDEALKMCRKKKSFLIDVTTEEFGHHFKERTYGLSVWLGATDKDHEGFFVWSDNTLMTLNDFLIWTDEKPANNETNDCIMIKGEELHVVSCTDDLAKVVCQEKHANTCHKNRGGCPQKCTPGKNHTKTCSCIEGYFMEDQDCKPINPCAFDKGGCGFRCTNPARGVKRCHCEEGYIEGIGQNCVKQHKKGLSLLNQLVVGALTITLIVILCATGVRFDLKGKLRRAKNCTGRRMPWSGRPRSRYTLHYELSSNSDIHVNIADVERMNNATATATSLRVEKEVEDHGKEEDEEKKNKSSNVDINVARSGEDLLNGQQQ